MQLEPGKNYNVYSDADFTERPVFPFCTGTAGKAYTFDTIIGEKAGKTIPSQVFKVMVQHKIVN